MRWRVALAMLVYVAAARAGEIVFDPADGALLPVTQVGEMLRQCSRASPGNVTGTWVPSQEQIHDMETRLAEPFARAFTIRTARSHQQFTPIPKFGRQYIGIVADGRRQIYVNAFPQKDILPNRWGTMASGNDKEAWRRKALLVCDGGPVYWGVAYDPERKTFSDFAFNGAPPIFNGAP